MTAGGPDPYAETVRLLPADTFTQQTRDEWVEIVIDVLHRDCDDGYNREDHRADAKAVVDALLAHLADQQARPMPGSDGQ